MHLWVVTSEQLDAAARVALRTLWDRAFGSRFDDNDADHAYGGVHVVARDGETLVAHASAVERRLRFGNAQWRPVGYVEAVATDPDHQRSGVGREVMLRLQQEIAARWPVAMLSTGQATGFYERLGWERWQGLSYTARTDGVVADDEHGGLMILRLDRAAVPDLTVDVTCEDRPGDAW
ncbi:MAG: GNAT family N-acetyltransferase [Actinomycetales bacterium]